MTTPRLLSAVRNFSKQFCFVIEEYTIVELNIVGVGRDLVACAELTLCSLAI